MKRLSSIIITLLIFLSACTPASTQTALSPSESAVATKTPSPTNTKTPSPTSTSTPTDMPTIALPQITFTPIPIKDADDSSTSPNGQWTAYSFWEGVPQLTVQNKDESVAWFITEGYFPEFPYTYIPLHWTKDSRYLFYNQYYEIEGLLGFYEGAGLYQLDLETGVSKEIIPATVDRWRRNFPALSIAPDDSFLIYIMNDEEGWFFTKYDLSDESKTQYKLDEMGGTFLWAIDQSYVLFSSCTIVSWDDVSCSIKRFDFSTNDISTVMPPAPQLLYIQKWINAQSILLFSSIEEANYKLNLQTGKMELY